MDPNASVCFDIPGGSEKRKREATDLDPLRFDVAPVDTDGLQNSRRGQSCLLEEILYPFVGSVAFGLPHFNRNPIYIANCRVML